MSRSRWSDVTKTVSMLSKTSCPAKSAFTMTTHKIAPSLAQKMDLSLTHKNVQAPTKVTEPPVDPAKGRSERVKQQVMAECSVAFKDYCLYEYTGDKTGGGTKLRKGAAPRVYVRASDLTKIFRQVEDNWGSPVVNDQSLKSWVSRSGFGKNQALGYTEFLKLCEMLVVTTDPMDRKAARREGSETQRRSRGTEELGERKYTSSWDHLSYEEFGTGPKDPNADHLNEYLNKSTMMDDSQWPGEQPVGVASLAPQESTDLNRMASLTNMNSLASSSSIPYLISQRKAAAASLFAYDSSAPEPQSSLAKVTADEMIALVKKQNRDNRKRDKREGQIGPRLFGMVRESVSVEGEHLSHTSQAEIFKRTQDYKQIHDTAMKDVMKKSTMANSLNTKLSVMTKHIAESKIKQMGKEFFTAQYKLCHDNKGKELRAKIGCDAKAERTITERRRMVKEGKNGLDELLRARETEKNERLSQLKRGKQVLTRQSAKSQGFPGLWQPDPKSPDQKISRKEKEERGLKYSQSLQQLHELKEERRGLKTVLNTSNMIVDGGDVFEGGDLGEDYEGQGSPGLDLRGPRPQSRGDERPSSSMFSAERIYNKDRLSPPNIPFLTTETRMKDTTTPSSVLRDIETPMGGRETAARLISSPTPWGHNMDD